MKQAARLTGDWYYNYYNKTINMKDFTFTQIKEQENPIPVHRKHVSIFMRSLSFVKKLPKTFRLYGKYGSLKFTFLTFLTFLQKKKHKNSIFLTFMQMNH